jgi:hypothetical protein
MPEDPENRANKSPNVSLPPPVVGVTSSTVRFRIVAQFAAFRCEHSQDCQNEQEHREYSQQKVISQFISPIDEIVAVDPAPNPAR